MDQAREVAAKRDLFAEIRNGFWHMAAQRMGAWPDNPTFPCGYDERDSKGV